MDLPVDIHEHDGCSLVAISGEVDAESAPALRARLNAVVAQGHHHLVIDLRKVDFLDSTGLGALVGVLQRVRFHDGSLHLVCTQEKILRIFRITGLTKVFPLHDSPEQALAAAGAERAGAAAPLPAQPR
ncbi:STAS domain-containing protein [Kineococcus sp. SYSU DK005]|uniref:STAS domain-containing protein n=1 Tax=Kineococcus sp. SYSU DK005 TaxID=3383126 RepID=UPI003D7E97EE